MGINDSLSVLPDVRAEKGVKGI